MRHAGDLPPPQGLQQHAEVDERDQRQHGTGHRGQEPAVLARGRRRVGDIDVRPRAVDDQQHPGPQHGDVELSDHRAERAERGPRGRPAGVPEHVCDHGCGDHRHGRRQPAHREARGAGAPAGVRRHDLPAPGEPATRVLGRGDPVAREPEAAEVGEELRHQDHLDLPGGPVPGDQDGGDRAAGRHRRGAPVPGAALAADDRHRGPVAGYADPELQRRPPDRRRDADQHAGQRHEQHRYQRRPVHG